MDHFNNYLECIEKNISILNEWLGKCLKGFCTIKVINYAISDFKCLPLQYPCMKDIVLLDKYFSFQLNGFFTDSTCLFEVIYIENFLYINHKCGILTGT